VKDKISRTVFGMLFESSTDAAFIVERRHGRVVSANLRAVDMLAREADVLVGMSLRELSVDSDRDIDGEGHYEDVAFLRGDGYPVYVSLQVCDLPTAEYGLVGAYMARDTSERRLLEHELHAKHSALFTAHAELERAHDQLEITKLELETRNHEIALLAWRAAMGELVAGIAHHLNNPVGALTSTVRRLENLATRLPPELRSEQERLLSRVAQITRRIESNVAAIVKASRSNALDDMQGRPELPPELETVLATFAERLDDIPTREPA
jgi:signal transduction histidine kinase